MRTLFKNILIFVVALFVVGSLLQFANFGVETKDVGLKELADQVEVGAVERIEVMRDTDLTVFMRDGTKATSRKEASESLPTLLRNYGVSQEAVKQLNVVVKSESGLSFWASLLLPIIIPILVIGGLLFFTMRQMQGANNRAMTFGQSGAREFLDQRKDRETFKDVAGAKEAKEELKEVVEFLKTPKKFQQMGARIPKGVLLVGSPGTGKTLLARAVAGEAGVPFFHISGSEFVEMFVGVGASRVRDLFRRAKKAAPCIVFIDEIDAVGRQRGAGLGGSHDEREQTLNQILVEMDGFEPNANVIVMAATNRPDVLDQALLRPGRFDRRVMIDLPDINDREAILQVHAKGKPVAPAVKLRAVAERTPGLSGADLANVMNEAAILAARAGKKVIESKELFDSIEKVLLGPERKSHVLSDKEKRVTAYHEVGHAVVSHSLPHSDPVHKISIISRGSAAGYTLKFPGEDKHSHTRAEFVDDLAVMLGGYVMEQEVIGELSTGPCNDLRQATKLARRMVTDYGMSALGPRTFGSREEMVFLGREISEQRDYGETTAQAIDREVAAFLKKAQATAKKIIAKRKADVEKVVKVLLTKETIEREEFEALLA